MECEGRDGVVEDALGRGGAAGGHGGYWGGEKEDEVKGWRIGGSEMMEIEMEMENGRRWWQVERAKPPNSRRFGELSPKEQVFGDNVVVDG